MDGRETVNSGGPYSDLQRNTLETGIHFLDVIVLPLRIILWSPKTCHDFLTLFIHVYSKSQSYTFATKFDWNSESSHLN